MKTIGILAACLALAACDAQVSSIDIDPTMMSYSRDVRTGICFASAQATRIGTGNAGSVTTTAVECNAGVMRLVPQSQGGMRSTR